MLVSNFYNHLFSFNVGLVCEQWLVTDKAKGQWEKFKAMLDDAKATTTIDVEHSGPLENATISGTPSFLSKLATHLARHFRFIFLCPGSEIYHFIGLFFLLSHPCSQMTTN